MRSRAVPYLAALLLLAAAALAAVPSAPVYGSTGLPTLGVTNTDSVRPTSYTQATNYVNVTAGSDLATTDGSVAGYLAIGFGTFGGSQLVTFSGTQFSLYLSKDGFSQVSPGDIRYAGPTPFNVADLTSNSGWHSVSEANGTFYVGQTTGGEEVVTGPVPLKVANDYKYVKIFDGSAASVAVGAQRVSIEPGIRLSPTSGPAGIPVTVTGGGFAPSTSIDLSYSFLFFPWSGAPSTHRGNWTTGLGTGSGVFTFTAPMVDSKQALNPTSGLQPVSSITVLARLHTRPYTSFTSATFAEQNRAITGVKSMSASGATVDFTNKPPGPFGNDSSPAGADLLQPVNVNVLGSVNVAGANWTSSSSVSFMIGTQRVGTASTDAHGRFNSTFPVPILPAGTDLVKVVDGGLAYQFSIQVVPTMTVTPSSGPVGTSVSVQAYGFPANGLWFIYWHEHSLGDNKWYQVAHGTTGATGSFNMTVTFTIPSSYGGSHSVAASSANASTSSPNPPGTLAAMAAVSVGSSSTVVTTTIVSSTTVTLQTTVTQGTTSTVSTTQTVVTTQATTVTMPVTQTQVQTSTQQVTVTSTSVSGGGSGDALLYGGGGLVVGAVVAGIAVWALGRRR